MAVKTTQNTDVTRTSTKNNSGTITANGSVSGTFVNTTTPSVNVGVFGSTVVEGNYAEMAFSGILESDPIVIAHNNNRPTYKSMLPNNAEYILSDPYYNDSGWINRPNSIVKSILDVNLGLKSGMVVNTRRSIHKLEVLRTTKQTTAIRNGFFNIFTGLFSEGYPVHSVDVLEDDNAANPTRDVPGVLVYKLDRVPVTVQYAKKTG